MARGCPPRLRWAELRETVDGVSRARAGVSCSTTSATRSSRSSRPATWPRRAVTRRSSFIRTPTRSCSPGSTSRAACPRARSSPPAASTARPTVCSRPGRACGCSRPGPRRPARRRGISSSTPRRWSRTCVRCSGCCRRPYLVDGAFRDVLGEARDYGQDLRRRLDRVLRQDVLPVLGLELGRWARAAGPRPRRRRGARGARGGGAAVRLSRAVLALRRERRAPADGQPDLPFEVLDAHRRARLRGARRGRRRFDGAVGRHRVAGRAHAHRPHGVGAARLQRRPVRRLGGRRRRGARGCRDPGRRACAGARRAGARRRRPRDGRRLLRARDRSPRLHLRGPAVAAPVAGRPRLRLRRQGRPLRPPAARPARRRRGR